MNPLLMMLQSQLGIDPNSSRSDAEAAFALQMRTLAEGNPKPKTPREAAERAAAETLLGVNRNENPDLQNAVQIGPVDRSVLRSIPNGNPADKELVPLASDAAPRSKNDILAELSAEQQTREAMASAYNDADVKMAMQKAAAVAAGGPYGPGGGGYKGVGRMEPLPDPKLPQAAPNFGQTAAEAQADYVGSRKDASAMARQRIDEMMKRGEIQRDMSFVGPAGPGKYTSSSGNVLDVGINRKGGYNIIGNAREQYMAANGGQEPPVSAGVSQRQQAVRDRKDPEKFAERKASGLAKQARLQDMRDPMGAPQRKAMRVVEQAIGGSKPNGPDAKPTMAGMVAVFRAQGYGPEQASEMASSYMKDLREGERIKSDEKKTEAQIALEKDRNEIAREDNKSRNSLGQLQAELERDRNRIQEERNNLDSDQGAKAIAEKAKQAKIEIIQEQINNAATVPEKRKYQLQLEGLLGSASPASGGSPVDIAAASIPLWERLSIDPLKASAADILKKVYGAKDSLSPEEIKMVNAMISARRVADEDFGRAPKFLGFRGAKGWGLDSEIEALRSGGVPAFSDVYGSRVFALPK